MADDLSDGFRRKPGKLVRGLIRMAMILFGVLLMPWVILRPKPRGESAFDALRQRAAELWREDPHEALSLLRNTHDSVLARGGLDPFKKVEIQPFGRFRFSDVLSTFRYVFDCQMTLGLYEEALEHTRSLPGRIDWVVLKQVDCLLALDRKAEAVALLEKNLDIDGWRGKLRARWKELGGRHLHVV